METTGQILIDADDVKIIDIEPPQCDHCEDGTATIAIHLDLRANGMEVGIGSYCLPCAREIADALRSSLSPSAELASLRAQLEAVTRERDEAHRQGQKAIERLIREKDAARQECGEWKAVAGERGLQAEMLRRERDAARGHLAVVVNGRITHDAAKIALAPRPCEVCRDDVDEAYMVHDAVWASAGMGEVGVLHLRCLEKRLGRALTLADLDDSRINNAQRYFAGRGDDARRERDEAQAGAAAMREALEWYAAKAAACRKITPEGDEGRSALDRDGGERARGALASDAGRAWLEEHERLQAAARAGETAETCLEQREEDDPSGCAPGWYIVCLRCGERTFLGEPDRDPVLRPRHAETCVYAVLGSKPC